METTSTGSIGEIRSALRRALKEQGQPLLECQGVQIPAASLWAFSRFWVHGLRERGLRPGDCLSCEAKPGPAFVSLLIAALHEGWWLQPLNPLVEPPQRLSCRAHVRFDDSASLDPMLSLLKLESLREAGRGPEEGGLILRSSATTGSGTWYALGRRNLWACLQAHLPELHGLEQADVLCTLPLFHAFGLVLDLLPALLRARRLVFPDGDTRDPERLAWEIRSKGLNRWSTVPRSLWQLWQHDPQMFSSGRGGLVGGAQVSAQLAEAFHGSAYQIGYGLTEASPGLMLAAPGDWQPSLLGRPLNCELRQTEQGELQFRGANAALARIEDNAFHVLDPQRWVSTGDLVTLREGRYYFRDRTAYSLKLANGRWFHPQEHEQLLQRASALEQVLFLADGEGGLNLYLSAAVSEADLQAHLGWIFPYVQHCCVLKADQWRRSPKGELLREAPLG